MAKYDSLRKKERNKELRRFHRSHPNESYAEVGKKFDVSESRAWRICNPKQKKTKSRTPLAYGVTSGL